MVKGSGNGWLKRKRGKLHYCWNNAEGQERWRTLGDASMSDADGWLEVAKLNLNQHVGKPDPKSTTFGQVLQHWITARPKQANPKMIRPKVTDERNARNYLAHWSDRIAHNMQPLEVQQWLDLQSRGLRSKLRNTMSAVFNHGQKFGLIPRGDEYNPMKLVSAPCKSNFEAVQLSGAEAVALIKHISDPLVRVLVILIAVTGMRISEALALPWDCINWKRGRIHITRKWNGKGYGAPKSKMSAKPVEMTQGLATVLQTWRTQTMYAKDEDLLFPSYRLGGKQPRLGGMLVEDHLRPAAVAAGVLEMRDGRAFYDGEPVVRFGFHNLRHGLATWLAQQGTNPAVIQRMLRHSSTDMTMHYIHPKAREAQEQYIAELGIADNGDTLRVQ